VKPSSSWRSSHSSPSCGAQAKSILLEREFWAPTKILQNGRVRGIQGGCNCKREEIERGEENFNLLLGFRQTSNKSTNYILILI
jgi:hypothetical protein